MGHWKPLARPGLMFLDESVADSGGNAETVSALAVLSVAGKVIDSFTVVASLGTPDERVKLDLIWRLSVRPARGQGLGPASGALSSCST